MNDPNLENNSESNLLNELELLNPSETLQVRLEGQALEEILSQIDRPALIQ